MPEEIRVAQGKFVNATTSVNVSRLVVGDPKIATAVPLTDKTFYILGKGEGRTNVAVYGAKDTLLGLVDVEVGADVLDLQQTIQNAVPQAKVKVDTINGRIRLSGAAPDGIAQRKIIEIAEQYSSSPVINAMNVTGGQQVLLEVRVVEANRNAGRELGISWFGKKNGGPSFSSGPAAVQGGININANLPSGNTPFGTMVAQILGGGFTADILIQALEEKGLGRRLAEPNLTALSGEKASFLAGGEIPIPVADNDGKIQLQFKEYGVRLNFTPTVLDNGTINLKLEPEVSQVDENTIIRTANTAIPAFVTRRASTTIEVRDGQSFAMAGLLQSIQTRNQDQLPWLGQLPVLGVLFRSSSFQEQETDLVIIVTPHLVRPAKPGQPLRTPLDVSKPSNDAEFFLLGNLEVSSDMQRRFAEGTGVVGPYGHIVNLKPEKTNARKKIAKP
ncbi:type II and III secretion system protein family protein [Microvirga sp. Mcv34]|uniref:type II and III secretion system protein family protein n=1 Tax=Microvirga sp. Mcv34 TaxID=2926016 RepID=UPI0021C6D4A5|nr:type II and III secretion system protein family protein [Microvirga sp. Mcv34]